MASNCYSCIMDRAKFECDLVFGSDEEKMRAMEELLDFMAVHKGGVPALVGTEREKIIKRRSGNFDPYKVLKAGSNALAVELLPAARKLYDRAEDKMEALVRIAAAANSMEFGVKGHSFDNETFGRVFEDILNENLDGDLQPVSDKLRSFQKIFYLTDNAGEVVFDIFVAGKLIEMGKQVVFGSKAEPVLNDVTAQELKGMTGIEVVRTGAVVGTTPDDLSQEAGRMLQDKSWLVLAKGMGNFETISEYQDSLKGRLIYMLRAKCEPVASHLNVKHGALVVRTL